jgi:hypothetical protein
MTKELKTIDLNILPLETLAEMANEAEEQAEKNAKATVQKAIDAGRYLIAAKEQLEHGQWAAWLGANWNYHQVTASRYMRVASKLNIVFNLTDAKTVSEALRMIGEAEPETTPRSERKPATVVVSVPDDHVVDTNKMVDEQPDDDPTPDPPTIRKTAKGSQKVSEDKQPRTQQVPVEIVPDEPEDSSVLVLESDTDAIRELFRRCVVPDEGDLRFVIESLIRKTENKHGQKKLASVLRKWGNELDPPTKFVKPDLSDVAEYFAELKAPEPESFFDFYESKGWLVGKTSMKDWRASARKWVRENANGSNNNGSAHRGTGKRGYTADEVFS